MPVVAAPKVAWRPDPGPQTALLACPLPDLLYGGARGGGKSAGLLMDFAAHAGRYGKDAHGIMFRRTYPELEELEKQAAEFYTPLGWHWKAGSRTWVAPNGATLKLRYLDNDTDADNYQGHEYTWQGFDEAGNWPTSVGIDKLSATSRSAKGIPCVRRLTANPGGPGHSWLRRRYVSPSQPYTPFTSETGLRAVFIPATMDDNQRLDDHYETAVRAATFGNEALWQAWRYGNWDVIAGAAFAEWSARVHVIGAHDIPAWWERIAGLDWGFRKGAAVYLGIAPDQRLEVVCDHVIERMDAETAGKYLATAWQPLGLPSWIVSSPDMWTNTGAGKTLAEAFRAGYESVSKSPCPMMQGDQSNGTRRVKKILTHQALRWTDDRDGNGELWPWAEPRLRFHTTAKYLIESIPALPVDKDKPEDDIDTTADDHGYDALGFVLAVRPPETQASPEVKGGEDRQAALVFGKQNPANVPREKFNPMRGKRASFRMPRVNNKRGITVNVEGL